MLRLSRPLVGGTLSVEATRSHIPVAALLVVGASIVLSPIPAPLRGAVANAVFGLVLLASFFVLGLSVRSRARGLQVYAWGAFAAVGSAQVLLAMAITETSLQQSPALPFPLLLAPLSCLVVLATLGCVAYGATDTTNRSVVAVDTFWIATVPLGGLWVLMAGPGLASSATTATKITLVALSVLTASLVGAVVALMLHSRGGHRSAMFDVAAGLIGLQAITVIYCVGWLNGGIDPSSPWSILYGPPTFLVAWTALRGWQSSDRLQVAIPPVRTRIAVAAAPFVALTAVVVTRGIDTGSRYVVAFALVAAAARMIYEVRRSGQLTRLLLLEPEIDSVTGTTRSALGAVLEDRSTSVEGALLIDLDRFKYINDQLGRRVGDQVLVHVARRLAGACGPDWQVTRSAGDEFVALCMTPTTDHALRTTSVQILEALARPFEVCGRHLWIGASIGGAARPVSNQAESTAECSRRSDSEFVVTLAELALSDAKKAGRSEIRLADDRHLERLDDLNQLGDHLSIALERGCFAVHYQPQIDLATGSLIGVEALVRWKHPTRGLMLPGAFLHVAEAAGRIAEIDECVLRQALADLAQWNRLGQQKLRLSVNMSAWQLARQDIAGGVREQLDRHAHSIDPAQLTVELPEGLLVDAPEVTGRRLTALAASGVSVSVDDFGAGFTSIAHLRRFPIDEVKIDRELTSELGDRPINVSVAASVIALARALELPTIAEGIETVRQASALRGLGCRIGQGFLFSKAVPAETISEWLTTGHRFEAALGGHTSSSPSSSKAPPPH